MDELHFLSINNIFYLQILQFNWPLDAIERQIGRLVNFSWNEKSNRRKFGISRIELGSIRVATKNLTVWAIEFLLLNFILWLFISNRNRFYKKEVFLSTFWIIQIILYILLESFLFYLFNCITLLAILQIRFRGTI